MSKSAAWNLPTQHNQHDRQKQNKKYQLNNNVVNCPETVEKPTVKATAPVDGGDHRRTSLGWREGPEGPGWSGCWRQPCVTDEHFPWLINPVAAALHAISG